MLTVLYRWKQMVCFAVCMLGFRLIVVMMTRGSLSDTELSCFASWGDFLISLTFNEQIKCCVILMSLAGLWAFFDVRNEDHYNKKHHRFFVRKNRKYAQFPTSGLLLAALSRYIAHYLCFLPSPSWRPAWQVSLRKLLCVWFHGRCPKKKKKKWCLELRFWFSGFQRISQLFVTFDAILWF